MATRRATVSKKRREAAERRGQHVIKGTSIGYPVSIERRYRRDMQRLIRLMREDYERALKSALPSDIAQDTIAADLASILRKLGRRWTKIWGRRADAMVGRMVRGVEKDSQTRLNKSLKELAGKWVHTPEMPRGLRDKLSAATKVNVSLIRSIPAKYHERIEMAVMGSVQTGGRGAASILDEVRKIGHSTDKRAHLIAVDQTRKITTASNVERMKSIGVTQYEWIHSGGGKEPRPLHVEYDGQIFSVEDPPVIDEDTGERGHPGQLIHCKCRMRLVLSF